MLPASGSTTLSLTKADPVLGVFGALVPEVLPVEPLDDEPQEEAPFKVPSEPDVRVSVYVLQVNTPVKTTVFPGVPTVVSAVSVTGPLNVSVPVSVQVPLLPGAGQPSLTTNAPAVPLKPLPPITSVLLKVGDEVSKLVFNVAPLLTVTVPVPKDVGRVT
jgi:hypothetical protein